ncbi:hypothetical protein F7725_006278, partial [Dissostichus mawsoni]
VVKSVQRRLGITGISLPSCPLWKNPIFTAGGNPLNNIHMQAHDIQHIGQIVKNNIITPFTVLMEHFNLNKSLFLSYMQLQSNIKNLTSKGIKIGCHEHLDMNLKRLANKKGMISGIYKLLLTSTANTNLQSQKRWEQDLGITLTPVEWDRIWSNSTSISKCVRFRVIQLKILHRAYITPCRLKRWIKHSRAYAGMVVRKWVPFTLSLVLSGCKISMGHTLAEILNIEILLTPATCLLGSPLNGITSTFASKLIALACLSTKRLVLMNWKVRKPNCFNLNRWLEDFLNILSMEEANKIN